MKEIIKPMLFCTILIICLDIVLAKAYIEDDADLISSSIEKEIKATISELDSYYGTNIGVLIKTVDDADESRAAYSVIKSEAYANLMREENPRFKTILIGIKQNRIIYLYWRHWRYALKNELKDIAASEEITDALEEEKPNFDKAFKFTIEQFAESVKQWKGKKECRVIDTYFANTAGEKVNRVIRGEKVKLVVEGEHCKDVAMRITLWEDDPLENDLVEEYDVKFETDKVGKIWNTASFEDREGEKNLKFFFVVEIPEIKALFRSIKVVSKSHSPRYGLLEIMGAEFFKDKRIAIDPSCNGDKNLNFEIAEKLQILLGDDRAFLTREKDGSCKEEKRYKYANREEAPIFVSIQSYSGQEKIYYYLSSKNGRRLANLIKDELNSSKVEFSNMDLLVRTNMPAVIIDFLREDPDKDKKIGQVMEGINNYVGFVGCEIDDTYFADVKGKKISKVKEGEKIKLIVKGRGVCKGATKITIMEKGYKADDYLIEWKEIEFKDNVAEADLVATRPKRSDERFDEIRNREFYFTIWGLYSYIFSPDYGFLRIEALNVESFDVDVTRYYTPHEKDFDGMWYNEKYEVGQSGLYYCKIFPITVRGVYGDTRCQGGSIIVEEGKDLVCYHQNIQTSKEESIAVGACKEPVESEKGEKLGEDELGTRGKTTAETNPTEGWTIAVDRAIFPLGSEVGIRFVNCERQCCYDWNRIYVAEDTGGAIKGEHIDLYVGVGLKKYNKINNCLPDKAEAYLIT